ncbi:MAG: putative beta-lysine N-acetyltransferase [Candidatus Gastranaerophilales bacterium]|nr:putative beta-lysine N-acetyltransferase [Candidatus Gastranaerophilales bacterium]
MSDSIIKIGKSIIQHGKENDRVYLMKLNAEDINNIIPALNELVENNKYTKIFAKVPSCFKQIFLKNKYSIEATIPNFYNNEQDALFLAKFFSQDRTFFHNKKEIAKVLKIASEKSEKQEKVKLKHEFSFKMCKPEDSKQMSEVYSKIFESYPFPIHDPNYIEETMQKNIDYFAIWHNDHIVALSSSEMDLESKNTEMTDFATLQEYQGNNLSVYLLGEMEIAAKIQGIKTAYTIARSLSFGMNVCFAKTGYTFCGTLINNTNICAGLESMNIWYKSI